MAMQGIPWTKVLGCIFLFAFLVIGAAALFYRRSVAPSVYSYLPGMQSSSAREAVEEQVFRRFEFIEALMFRPGLMCNCAVLIWAFCGLWALRIPAFALCESFLEGLPKFPCGNYWPCWFFSLR
jgi:hypothetical protein